MNAIDAETLPVNQTREKNSGRAGCAKEKKKGRFVGKENRDVVLSSGKVLSSPTSPIIRCDYSLLDTHAGCVSQSARNGDAPTEQRGEDQVYQGKE